MLVVALRHLLQVTGWTNQNVTPLITETAALQSADEQVTRAQLPQATGVLVWVFGDPGAGHLAKRFACPVIRVVPSAAEAAAEGSTALPVTERTPDPRVPTDALLSICVRTG